MRFVVDEKIVLGQGIFTTIFHGILNSESIAAKRSVDVDLLLKEAHFLKLCDHPNVVHFKGLLQIENESCLLMEFAAEGSLHDHLGLNHFSRHQKLSFIRQICLGLHHIHSRGILHGDLKPGHILLKDHKQIVITDFSSAQEPAHGTHHCIGLEIVPEVEYTFTSDVYLLALVAYQILEDKKYASRKALNVAIKEETRRPGGLDKNIFLEPDWERMIVDTVLKNPEDRPGVLDFHDAFKE